MSKNLNNQADRFKALECYEDEKLKRVAKQEPPPPNEGKAKPKMLP